MVVVVMAAVLSAGQPLFRAGAATSFLVVPGGLVRSGVLTKFAGLARCLPA